MNNAYQPYPMIPVSLSYPLSLVSSGGDKASLNFMELGHIDGNGMVKANGAAFYDTNATGKLAYLSNTVSVYTDEVNKHGNGKVVAWEWNK